jgi:hypothetical protein
MIQILRMRIAGALSSVKAKVVLPHCFDGIPHIRITVPSLASPDQASLRRAARRGRAL